MTYDPIVSFTVFGRAAGVALSSIEFYRETSPEDLRTIIQVKGKNSVLMIADQGADEFGRRVAEAVAKAENPSRSLIGDVPSDDEYDFQLAVKQWMLECFGEEILIDRRERNFRFIEEALELVQASGASKEDVSRLVDYVFDRPAGDIVQEIGATLLTLAALCVAHGIDMDMAGHSELARVHAIIDRIRAKHRSKPVRSPLPGEAP